jgi:hypothetical protein
VALKNYYSGLEGIIPLIGPPAKFQTAAGGKVDDYSTTVNLRTYIKLSF